MQSAQTIPVRSAPLQFPQSKPTAESISQLELEMLLALRGRLKQLQNEVSVHEEAFKARLQAGAIVEPGDHTAGLKECSRRNVAWKAVVIRLALRLKMDGEAYCERVLAATKPTKSVSLEVH